MQITSEDKRIAASIFSKKLSHGLRDLNKLDYSVLSYEQSRLLIKNRQEIESLQRQLRQKHRLDQQDMPLDNWIGQIGEKYEITFKDPNYPCDCACHYNRNICHIMSCCNDNSWTKTLVYKGLFQDSRQEPAFVYHLFEKIKTEEDIIPLRYWPTNRTLEKSNEVIIDARAIEINYRIRKIS